MIKIENKITKKNYIRANAPLPNSHTFFQSMTIRFKINISLVINYRIELFYLTSVVWSFDAVCNYKFFLKFSFVKIKNSPTELFFQVSRLFSSHDKTVVTRTEKKKLKTKG